MRDFQIDFALLVGCMESSHFNYASGTCSFYSWGFLDDSQIPSLEQQVGNQREVMEKNQQEVRGQGSHYRFSAERFPIIAVSEISFMVSGI